MSKKKDTVNNIIYELDNEDVDSESSEEEKKEVKGSYRSKFNSLSSKIVNSVNANDINRMRVVDVDLTNEDECAHPERSDDLTIVSSPINGLGQESEEKTISIDVSESPPFTIDSSANNSECENIESIDSSSKNDNTQSNDLISKPTDKISNSVKSTENEIVSESSAQVSQTLTNDSVEINCSENSDATSTIASCENKTPIVSIKFRDTNIAKSYRDKIKQAMIKLIKLHDKDNLIGSDDDSDLELDIWPEDLPEDEELEESQDSCFFVDTTPGGNETEEVPTYCKITNVLSNVPEKEFTPPAVLRRQQICFNCDGTHNLRDCSLPRNNSRISEKRKAMNEAMKTSKSKLGRYHVEDDQRFGHLVPGRISGQLRHALGLKRDELPLHIYRMRMFGYPPGWLEEARISHSGITMFDSSGNAVKDPEDEDGEIIEQGSKDKFDIKKILDFPGFNVPASSRYKEESHLHNLPPISGQDSKLHMLQALAPNAMKAYKRKKLTFFPSSLPNNLSLEGQTEMELDDGEEMVIFPSVPPLPDEVPPPPPPPPPDDPPLPPDDPPLPPDDPPLPPDDPPLPPDDPPLPPDDPPLPPDDPPRPPDDPPLPPDDPPLPLDDPPISIDSPPLPPDNPVCEEDIKLPSSNDSPQFDASASTQNDPTVLSESIISIDDDENFDTGRTSPSLADLVERKRLLLEALKSGVSPPSSPESTQVQDLISQSSDGKEKIMDSDSDDPKTPLGIKGGKVKSTLYGTPVLNTASPFMKLPSDDKFAKDICDVINYENLPDSIGKYEKISSLLKRVKSEVDRIQES